MRKIRTSWRRPRTRGQARRRTVGVLAIAILAAGAVWIAWPSRQITTLAPRDGGSAASASTPLPASAAQPTALVSAVSATGAGDGVARFHNDIQPVLKTYCYTCHGDGEKSGNIAFDKLSTEDEILNPALWLKVMRNVR